MPRMQSLLQVRFKGHKRARKRAKEGKREGVREKDHERERKGTESATVRARRAGSSSSRSSTHTSHQESPFLHFDSRLIEALTPGRLSFSAHIERAVTACDARACARTGRVGDWSGTAALFGCSRTGCGLCVPSEKSENFAGTATASHRLSAPARPLQPHTSYCALSGSSFSASDCALPIPSPFGVMEPVPRFVHQESHHGNIICML